MIEIPNSSLTPEETFSVTSDDLLRELMNSQLPDYWEVLGFAHTHPVGCFKPSDDDIDGIDEDLFGVVFCGQQVCWYDSEGEFIPLVLDSALATTLEQ